MNTMVNRFAGIQPTGEDMQTKPGSQPLPDSRLPLGVCFLIWAATALAGWALLALGLHTI